MLGRSCCTPAILLLQLMPLLRFMSPVVLTFTLSAALPAQAALRAAPSTRATSEVTLTYPEGQAPADAKPLVIRVDYGQPHLRGRALHTDSLVPYDKPWRVGANAATRFTTDAELVLGGATITKGTYVLFAVPSRTAWKLIVQKTGRAPKLRTMRPTPSRPLISGAKRSWRSRKVSRCRSFLRRGLVRRAVSCASRGDHLLFPPTGL